MNKLFTKIAAATLGVAMAIGVGVAVSHSGVAKETRADAIISWSRVTSTDTLLEGGTFIIGYEATADSGAIIPMSIYGTATTSANGIMYSGADIDDKSTASTNKTLDMKTLASASANHEVQIGASSVVDGAVFIRVGSNYLGNENTKNNCKLFTSESKKTSFTPTMDSDDKIQFDIKDNNSGSKYRYLKYNTSSPRMAVYASGQKDLVAYKKIVNEDPSISFTPSSLSLRTGQSASTVKATASNVGTGISYSWTIKDGESTSVVSLSNKNTDTVSVTPSAAGSTILQCVATGSTGNVTGYVNVSVALSPTSVTFNDTDPASSSYTLSTYDSYSYKAMPAVTVAPEGVSQDVTYTITSGDDLIGINDNQTRINILRKVNGTETGTIKIASAVDESVFATLTVSVSHDSIAGIRVKPDTSIPTQYIGTTFNTNGIQFQKKHTNNTSWVNFDSDDSVFSETEITSETTSARVYLTGSDKTIYCDVTGFTVSDYSGTYNIVSTRTTYTADVTAEQFKQYTENSANFSFVPSGIRLGCSPGSGEAGKKSDIVLEDSNASLQIIAPTGFVISRISVSVSAKSGSQSMTIGGYEWEGITKDKRSVLTEYPFTNSDTLSATNWMYIEYINITLVNSSNASAVALAYGLSFNELTAEECEAMAGISDDTWGYVKDYFDAAVSANSGAEALIKGGQANKTGDALGQALYRYDMIVAKYSKTDFLSRTGGSSGANRVQGTNSSANIAIIIVVSSVSLISLGALLAFKKKKEQ